MEYSRGNNQFHGGGILDAEHQNTLYFWDECTVQLLKCIFGLYKRFISID